MKELKFMLLIAGGAAWVLATGLIALQIFIINPRLCQLELAVFGTPQYHTACPKTK